MIRRFLAASAVLALASTTAFANPQLSNIDFAAAFGDSTGSGPVVVNGTTFSSTDAYLFGNNGGLYTELGSVVLTDTSNNYTGTAPLTVTFATPQTSVGFGFALSDFLGLGGGDTVTVTDSNSVTQVETAALLGSDLFPEGYATFADATPFTTLTFTGAYTLTLAPIPEPASMALLGAGLAGIAAARRRRA